MEPVGAKSRAPSTRACAGGVTFATYLPDSRFAALELRLEEDLEIQSVRCAREDDAVAAATGAAMGGAVAVSIMEATGLGLSGLILARVQVQHTPLVVLAAHAAGPGEDKPFHSTAIAGGGAVLRGLGIPTTRLDDLSRIPDTVAQTLVTARAQRTVYALVLPGLVFGQEGDAA